VADTVTEPPPCRDAPRKVKLSWSRLKNYETCHKRAQLLTKGKKSVVINGRDFLPGTLADRAMRAWLEEGVFETGGMEKFLDQLWRDHTGPEAEYTIKWKGNPREDKARVITNVRRGLARLEPILLEKVAPYPFKPEYRFTATLGLKDPWGATQHIEMFGAVDVAVLYPDGHYGLFDLKMTENGDYIRSTLAQLTFYNLAFRGWTGVIPTEHAFWVPLIDPSVIPLDVTDDERRAMIARIIAYCHGVWTDRAELTADESACFNCPTKHACPRFVQPIQKDAQGRNRVAFARSGFDLMTTPEGV
jgi:hypothetical protein